MATANFKTYDTNGKELLNAKLATYCFVKSGKLTRLVNQTYEQSRKFLGKKSRYGQWGNKNVWGYTATPHYCVYYIDLPLDSISPLPFIYWTGTSSNVDSVPSLVYLNTGKVENKTRLFFYSNGRLSDSELNSFNIYVFDIKPLKEDKVGLNLYNEQGQLTFSSKTYPLNIVKVITTQDTTENQSIALANNVKAGVSTTLVRIFNIYTKPLDNSFSKDTVYNDQSIMESTKGIYITSMNNRVSTKYCPPYTNIKDNGEAKEKSSLRSYLKSSGKTVADDILFNLEVDNRGSLEVAEMEFNSYFKEHLKDVLENSTELKGLVIDVKDLPFPFN